MRPRRYAPMLAAALALASASPAAAVVPVGLGSPREQPALKAPHHSGDSTESTIAIIAAAGGLTVAGAGLAARRSRQRRAHRTPTTAR